MTCPRCSKPTSVQVNSYTKVCSHCGWQLTKAYINTMVKLAGVTYDGRQGLISSLSVYDPIMIRRDRNNAYDRNAIGIYNSRNQNIGWIPRDVAATLAPKMDSGVKLYAKTNKKLGGNGYNYGLEVFISSDSDKTKNHQPVTPTVPTNKLTAYASKPSSYSSQYYKDDDDYDDYPSHNYFRDESERGSDDYDPSEDWTDLFEYNENH
ncbi:HIRAN domain-containing protein [Neobacillus drentensis]|uniref:HIRAN domain-containing protein n=1 Tax=Neobacillus drentensis TaxID=220684 RepID=UPI002FFE3332